MNLKIRVFAGLAEHMGGQEIEVAIEGETVTAGELKAILAERFPQAAASVAVAFIAKNQAYAPAGEILTEADEIALIPPVSGGQGLAGTEAPHVPQQDRKRYELTREKISADEVAEKVIHPNCGATLTFIGTTREYTEGQRTLTLEYEAYEPMALATMEQIGEEVSSRWPGATCAITHRLGRVDISETSVVIAVSSPHRAECYDASRYAIERLKQIVPIWKKEIWEDGSEWKGHQLGPWNPTASFVTPREEDCSGGR